MNEKTVLAVVLLVAVAALAGGYVLGASGEDEHPDDGVVHYTVVSARLNGDGTASLNIHFDADPGEYYIYFHGQELVSGDGKTSGFYAADSSGYSDHAYGSTPWVKVPHVSGPYELRDEVELRSYSLDLVRSTS